MAGARPDGVSLSPERAADRGVPRPREIVDETVEVFSRWPALARQWGVPEDQIAAVASKHRFVSPA